MRQFFTIIFSVIVLASCTKSTEDNNKLLKLKEEVNAVFEAEEGDFAMAFLPVFKPEDLLLINATEEFHAASTMKTPVMVEVFKQVADGNFGLNDSILIKNDFYSIVDSSKYTVNEDTENELYNMLGDSLTIYDVMYRMIIKSSNLGTNLIVEKVGAKNVTQTMRDLGAPYIKVLRGVEDLKAFDQGLSNTTTAFDLMVIFEMIAKGKAVSSEASQQMIEVLLDQKYNDIIPARLPSDVKVAHKTGEITGVRHDSGIVILPNGRQYVLVLLSKNLKNTEQGIEKMAQVSKMVYDYVMALKP